MKKLVFIILVHIWHINAFAQDMRDGTHIFNYAVTLPPCSLAGVITIGASSETIMPETRFIVRTITATHYVIQIVKFTQKNAGRNAAILNPRLVQRPAMAAVPAVLGVPGVAAVGGLPAVALIPARPAVAAVPASDIYFLISRIDYDNNAERFMKRGNFTVGASTTLIKIRPGKKDPTSDGTIIYSEFGNDFNIGFSAGWKFKPYRKKELSHSFVGSFGFSSIKVTPYTTKKFSESESTQSCITVSGGYVLEYNKFQISLFTGLDLMSGEIGKHWIYKDRPWIGIGFGYQIFRAQGETDN